MLHAEEQFTYSFAQRRYATPVVLKVHNQVPELRGTQFRGYGTRCNTGG